MKVMVEKSRKGMTSLEVSLMGVLCAVFCILTTNCLLYVWAYSFNDQACRDAARAAASCGNAADAYGAVLASLNQHRTDGTFVSNPACDTTAHPSDFVYVDQPSDGLPYVQVTTRSKIAVPFCTSFFSSAQSYGPAECARTYLFPLLAQNFTAPVIVSPSNRGLVSGGTIAFLSNSGWGKALPASLQTAAAGRPGTANATPGLSMSGCSPDPGYDPNAVDPGSGCISGGGRGSGSGCAASPSIAPTPQVGCGGGGSGGAGCTYSGGAGPIASSPSGCSTPGGCSGCESGYGGCYGGGSVSTGGCSGGGGGGGGGCVGG